MNSYLDVQMFILARANISVWSHCIAA